MGLGSEWTEIKSPHFTVISNGNEKAARGVARQFEQVRSVFETIFPRFNVNPGRPFIIIAAKNSKSFFKFLPELKQGRRDKKISALFAPGDTRYFVLINLEKNQYESIYHEYVHLVNSLNFAYLPLWLNEGLACYFQNMNVEIEAVEIGKKQENYLKTLRQRGIQDFHTFLKTDHNSPFYKQHGKATVFYAQAWGFTHYLLQNQEAREKNLLRNFITQLSENQPVAQVTQAAFGDLNKLQKDFEAYIERDRLFYTRYNTSLQTAPLKYPHRNLELSEVTAWKGIFFTARRKLDLAKPVLERAVLLDANLPLAHEGLGYLNYIQNQLTEAGRHFGKVLDLDPNYAFAHFYLGRIIREQHHTQGDLLAAAIHFQKCISLYPDFAPAYSDLGSLYGRLAMNGDNAIELIRNAMHREMGYMSHRLRLLNTLIDLERYQDAVEVGQMMLNLTDRQIHKDFILTRMQIATNLINGY